MCLQQTDKAATTLKNSVEQFQVFIDAIDKWLANNRERALTTFQTFDVNSTGKVTHDQLKAGTFPCFSYWRFCSMLQIPEMIFVNILQRNYSAKGRRLSFCCVHLSVCLSVQ